MTFVRPPRRRFRYWMWLAPPGMAVIAALAAAASNAYGCLDEFLTALVPAFLGLPLLAQALPSTRRRGGICSDWPAGCW